MTHLYRKKFNSAEEAHIELQRLAALGLKGMIVERPEPKE